MKKRIVLTNLKKQKKKNPNKIIQIGILFVCFVINATIIPTIIIPSYAEKKIEKEYKEIIKQATIKAQHRDGVLALGQQPLRRAVHGGYAHAAADKQRLVAAFRRIKAVA